MGDQYVAPKIMRRWLDVTSKQAYRLIEEKVTKDGVKPSTIPYKRVSVTGKADTKEILISEIAKYIYRTLPIKKSDIKREQKRIAIQEDSLKKIVEILGNGK